ncbi:MAG: acetyltransferase [Phycisphaerae bacterium]|nr:acetyltransferase [Phycisphaerae bacterium]
MKIVIVGAGGHGRVVLDILSSNHQFQVVGFLDNNIKLHNRIIDGTKVLGDLNHIDKIKNDGICGAIIAIGDNRIRKMYAKKILDSGLALINAIHPSANIAGNAKIGKNVTIAAGANICANAVIEDSVILNTGCIIEHECLIKNSSHICPGVKLAGHVTVEKLAFVGIGATVIQGIKIDQSAIVGAGAVVISDVSAFTTVVGAPAKPVKLSHIPGHVDETPPPKPPRQFKFVPSTSDLEPARSIINRPQRISPPKLEPEVIEA